VFERLSDVGGDLGPNQASAPLGFSERSVCVRTDAVWRLGSADRTRVDQKL